MDSSIVSLDETQFNTFVESMKTINILTNRVEFLLILNCIILGVFIFSLLRSKS